MIPWWWLIVAWAGAQAAVIGWLWFLRGCKGDEVRGETGEDDCDSV